MTGHKKTGRRPCGQLLAAAAALSVAHAGPSWGAAPDGMEFFESRIRPIFLEHCQECHASETKQKGGLRLDSRAGWMTGGESGPAVVPGDPGESLLIRAVEYLDPDLQMPPENRLSQGQIADLREWVALGAPDPREETAAAPAEQGFDLEARKRAHWAWQPLERVEPPVLEDDQWSRTATDRFLLARLRREGLEPSRDAEPRVLARRVYFDLTGLPPAAEALDAFAADVSPGAYERLVDRLLASPHFGERWGQHWLDLVRYAETWGHEQDFAIPEAWRYRDYVVRAFNDDVPYDTLLVEHVAGDLVDPPRVEARTRENASIQGTGFWHLGEATHSPVDIRGDESLRVANQIDVFSKAFMALTVSCARCHDHKFDAISTGDYYALFGYLQSSGYHLADISDPAAQREAAAALQALKEEELPALRAAVGKQLARQAEDVPAYLEAALVRLGETEGSVAAAACGEAKGLDEGRIARWVAELEKAASEAGHPLQGAARAALRRKDGAEFAAAVREARQALESEREDQARRREARRVVRTVQEGERNYVRTESPFDPARDVVLDYAAAAPEGWLAFGRRFGDGPAAPGDLVLGSGPDRPVLRVAEEPAAESDLLSGRFTGMLRTPTFEVTSDRLWIRYAGQAQLFIEVDSHRVCQGPLHSQGLRQELNAPGNAFRWAAHDVSKYIGHRVRLECTPAGPFALSRIVFAAEEPVEIPENPVWPDGAETAEDWAGLAAVLGGALREATLSWAAGGETAEDRERVNWLLGRSELLAGGSMEASAAVARFFARKAEIESRIPEPVRALALVEGSAENEPVHIRGSHRNVGAEPVPRRFLQALGGSAGQTPAAGSGRLEMARQLVDSGNPLTARVLVNRVWHYLFGRGLVSTVDNFGATGMPPTHPELLDYLALDFMERGWSVKHVVREILLSSAYRQSSLPDPAKEAVDPTNELLHRMPIRRLEAEQVRDAVLAVSGRLDRAIGGPSVPVHVPPFMRSNRSPSTDGPMDGAGRRSIYVEARRNHLDPFLLAFDRPTPFTAIGQRNVSNSPAQPLILLNNPLLHEQARLWARRLLALPNHGPAERLEAAYRMAYGRRPETWETEAALEFLAEEAAPGAEPGEEAWTSLCHTLFNVKEFIFVN